jgi:hypothetical protein
MLVYNTLALGLCVMLNPCKMIQCMQCPGSACLLSPCVYNDLYGKGSVALE